MACRRVEARQAQEALQARVIVLEGRVRFLEADCEMRPAPQQQPLALPCSSAAAPPLALTWGPASSSGGTGRALGQPAAGSWSAAAGASVPAPVSAAAMPHWGQPPRPVTEQHGHVNPLFESQIPASMMAAAAAMMARPHAAPWQGAAAGTAADAGVLAHASPPPQQQQLQQQQLPLPPGRAAVAVLPTARSFGSASELISSMQARFSEAEEFLRSLQGR